MPFKTVPNLTGGEHSAVANPELLKDHQLKESVNYEDLQDGVLTKRTDPIEFGDLVGKNNLSIVVRALFNDLLQISPPYYPTEKLSDMTGDYGLLVYGKLVDSELGDLYLMYFIYEKSTGWTTKAVIIDEIEYTVNTFLEFFIGDEKIIITDNYRDTENKPHYVKIDPEGVFRAGKFGLPAPTNKASLAPTDTYKQSDFEENPNSARLDDCGLFQCMYTVETEDGDESNPSPLSETKDLQFFLNDTDGNDARWVDLVQVSDLTVPDITDDLLEKLKYFNVYYRIIRYSEGESAKLLSFSQQFEIVDKENHEGVSANIYSLVLEADLSRAVSFDNDISPIARHAAENSSILMVGNTREKIKFPYRFEKFAKILVQNNNSKNYVDAVIKVRLYDSLSGASDIIEELDWEYYNAGVGGLLQNLEQLRIYDTDLITPLSVAYFNYSDGDHFLDVYINIPLLVSGQTKILNIVFNTTGATEPGVNRLAYQSTDYGEFLRLPADWDNQKLFKPERVRSSETVICAPLDLDEFPTKVINKVDFNNNGVFSDETTADWSNQVIAEQLLIERLVGRNSIQLLHDDAKDNSISFPNLPFTDLQKRTTFYGRIKYNGTKVVPEGSPNYEMNKGIAGFHNNVGTPPNVMLSLNINEQAGTGNIQWILFAGEESLRFSGLTAPVNTSGTGNYFICISIDFNNKASLFILDLESQRYEKEELEWSEWTDTPESANFEDYTEFKLGRVALSDDVIDEILYDQWQIESGRYFSALDKNDQTAIWNIANFMPAFDEPIGAKII